MAELSEAQHLAESPHVIVILLAILIALIAIHLIKDVFKEKDKNLKDEIRELKESNKELKGELASFRSNLSSCMHSTIQLTDKMESLGRFDGKFRRFTLGLKFLAGDDWEHCKKAMDEEDITT